MKYKVHIFNTINGNTSTRFFNKLVNAKEFMNKMDLMVEFKVTLYKMIDDSYVMVRRNGVPYMKDDVIVYHNEFYHRNYEAQGISTYVLVSENVTDITPERIYYVEGKLLNER